MKLLKPSIVVLLTVFSLASTMSCAVAPASAPVEFSNPEAYEFLLTRGFPTDVLDSMDAATLEYYASVKTIRFKSQKVQSFILDENGHFEEVSPSPPSPHSHIPDGQLTISTKIFEGLTSDEKNVTRLYFNLDYVWNDLPINRFDDALCITWNPKLLRYSSKSFSKKDYYQYLHGDWYLHESASSPTTIQADGIAWYANLRGDDPVFVEVTGLKGHAQFELVPASGSTIPNMTGSLTTFYGKHAHPNTSVTVGFDFEFGENISVTGSSDYGELAFTHEHRF